MTLFWGYLLSLTLCTIHLLASVIGPLTIEDNPEAKLAQKLPHSAILVLEDPRNAHKVCSGTIVASGRLQPPIPHHRHYIEILTAKHCSNLWTNENGGLLQQRIKVDAEHYGWPLDIWVPWTGEDFAIFKIGTYGVHGFESIPLLEASQADTRFTDLLLTKLLTKKETAEYYGRLFSKNRISPIDKTQPVWQLGNL